MEMMVMEMSVEEMVEMVYEFDFSEMSCEACPFRAVCDEYELYWGCSVWEDSMGEDL